MHCHAPALHSHPHSPVCLERPHTSFDIHFRDAVALLLHARVAIHLALDLSGESAKGCRPDVEDTADGSVAKSRLDHVAACVAAEDDVLDLQIDDGVFDDGKGVEICGRDDVGDVAVDKDVTWLEAEDRSLRHTGIGATEPYCSYPLIPILVHIGTLD